MALQQDFILSNLLTKTRNIFTNQRISKMAVATKIQLPYLEDTGLDGKKIYTPKIWTERLHVKNPQHRYQTDINR